MHVEAHAIGQIIERAKGRQEERKIGNTEKGRPRADGGEGLPAGTTGIYQLYTMFFDATVRGHGNELESTASYLLFNLAMEWTQKSTFVLCKARKYAHTIFIGTDYIMNRPPSSRFPDHWSHARSPYFCTSQMIETSANYPRFPSFASCYRIISYRSTGSLRH